MVHSRLSVSQKEWPTGAATAWFSIPRDQAHLLLAAVAAEVHRNCFCLFALGCDASVSKGFLHFACEHLQAQKARDGHEVKQFAKRTKRMNEGRGRVGVAPM